MINRALWFLWCKFMGNNMRCVNQLWALFGCLYFFSMVFGVVISQLSSSDVITIDKTNENFRLIYDVKGRFTIHRITADEAKVRSWVILYYFTYFNKLTWSSCTIVALFTVQAVQSQACPGWTPWYSLPRHPRWPHHQVPRPQHQSERHNPAGHCLLQNPGYHQLWLWCVLDCVTHSQSYLPVMTELRHNIWSNGEMNLTHLRR